MATYEIRLWDETNLVTMTSLTRRTRTSAADAAYKLAYETLAAFGKLDTLAAHVTRDKIQKWDDLLPIGAQRSYAISNTGRTVTMMRHA